MNLIPLRQIIKISKIETLVFLAIRLVPVFDDAQEVISRQMDVAGCLLVNGVQVLVFVFQLGSQITIPKPDPLIVFILDFVAVHQCSYAYSTLHRAHGDFTWLFAGLMGAAAWRPVRRASTTISGSLLEQIIVPGCAASQRTGKVWRYQRGFSMRSIERQTFQQSNDWFPAFEETYGDRFG